MLLVSAGSDLGQSAPISLDAFGVAIDRGLDPRNATITPIVPTMTHQYLTTKATTTSRATNCTA